MSGSPTGEGSRATDSFDLTDAREWLEIDVDAKFEQPDWIGMVITYNIHEVLLSEPYSQIPADEIRARYDYERKTLGTEPPILSQLLQRTREITNKIVNETTYSTTRIFQDPLHDKTSFYEPPDENRYEPPVVVTQECRFNLNELAYFTPEEVAKYEIKSLYHLLDGSLKMGAKVTLDLKLIAEAGHKMQYLFRVEQYEEWTESYQDQLTITHNANEVSTLNKDRVVFTVDNLNNLYPSVSYKRGVMLRAKSVNAQTKEVIKYDFNIQLSEIDRFQIKKSTMTINSLLIRDSMFELPSNISGLIYISTDGLRLYLDNGLLKLEDIERGLSGEFGRLENQFGKAFNTTTPVTLNKTWSMDTITGLEPLYNLYDTSSYYRMGSERPIICNITTHKASQITLFENATSTAVTGLLNAGAKAQLDLYISLPYTYTYNLTLPAGLQFQDLSPQAPNATPNSGGGLNYILTPLQLKNLRLVAQEPVEYTTSKANVTVEIDIREVDILSLSEYLASVRIKADGVLNHIRNERGSSFDKALPKGMTLDYYNSDALRLVYTEGLLDLEEIEDSLYSMIEENISNMLEEDVKMFIDFNEELLEFDGDIGNMDDSQPVTFGIRSRGKMRITENKLVRMGGLVTKQLELPLIGVKYWNVSYKLILPKYIHILGRAKVKNSTVNYMGPMVDRNSEDRDELYITIDSQSLDDDYNDVLEVNVKVDIDISIWFFLSKIVIPIILFIVLCIVIVFLKLHRRYKTKKIEQLMSDPDVVVEEVEDTEGMGGRSFKKPSRIVTEKERRKMAIDSKIASKEDYSERLEELKPMRAMGLEKGSKKGRRRARKQKDKAGRGKRRRAGRRMERY